MRTTGGAPLLASLNILKDLIAGPDTAHAEQAICSVLHMLRQFLSCSSLNA